MHIATGQSESHPTPLPLDESQSPATARPTAVVPGQLTGPTVDARDTQAEYAAPLAALESNIRAAQAEGTTAEQNRREHYHADMLLMGAEYGDTMSLPDVPAYTVPPASSALYPWSGDEPVGAA